MLQIDDQQLGFEAAWEGTLTASGETFAVRDKETPRVSIGAPTYWTLGAPAPPEQVATGATAVNGPQYGLARFPFSLRPGAGQRVQRADFTVSLYPSGSGERPLVYDAYPATTTVTHEGEVTAKLGPDFKFAGAETSLGGVEGTIKLKRPAAVITVYGLGESDVSWAFQEAGEQLLDGSLVVYAVVALPPGIAAARAVARLTVRVNTQLGSFLGRLPDTAAEKVSWVLG